MRISLSLSLAFAALFAARIAWSEIPGVAIPNVDEGLRQWLRPTAASRPIADSRLRTLRSRTGVIEDGAWSELGPPFRSSHAAVLDPTTRRMIVWGGFGLSEEVWSWNLDAKTWTRLQPAGEIPRGRGDLFGVLDPIGRRILFVDGTRFAADGEEDFNEVWELTLDAAMTWRRLDPKGTIPSQRFGAAFIYDPLRQRLLMQGGFFSGFGWTDETWALSLGPQPEWSQLHPPGVQPPGRYDHVAVYDSRRDRLVIEGGAGASDSVWVLPLGDSTASWIPLGPGGIGPGRREVHVAAYDSLTDRLIVAGGRRQVDADSIDAWQLNFTQGDHWEPIVAEGQVPANRADATMILDPEDRSLLLYGGDVHIGSSCEIWRLPLDPPSHWSRLAPRFDAPEAMWIPSVVYDGRRHRVIVMGELLEQIDSLQTFTLALGGSPEWKPLHPLGNPPLARAGAAAIYDPVRDRVVIYGGVHQNDYGVFLLNDMWALELAGTPTWRRLQPWNNPYSGLAGAGATYDPARDRMMLFGGWAKLDSGADGITNRTYALSLGDAPEWTWLTTPDPPPPRTGSALFYDPRRDRLAMFGGTGDRYRLNDTWLLPLNNSSGWQEAASLGDRPRTREAFASIYDPIGDRFIINGGFVTGDDWTYGEDFWSFSLAETAWTELHPAGVAIPGRTHHAAIYDPREDRMLVIGGRTWFDYAPDLWTLDLHRSNATTFVRLVGTEFSPGSLSLMWQGDASPGTRASLERLEPGGAWSTLGGANADSSGSWSFRDSYPNPGERRSYRLAVETPEGNILSDPAWVGPFQSSVPVLAGVRPNPVSGVEPMVWFTLRSSEAARLDVFRVTGQRLGGFDVGTLGPGVHSRNLQGLIGSRPGIYFVRLTQGDASATCKMVQL